ncbi:protein kinase [Nocardia sp. NPDC058640]|uniref:serine/threonine protein kinase n=1 Tax=Nocardia sp. NPDC058640 TaxID=3346571 RepID=UPI00365F2871
MVQLVEGQTFADYTIEGTLGKGGMGSVYLARHPRLERRIALKLLAPEVSSDADLRRRFEQEAQAIARLDHPSIVGIHDRGMHEGQLWIAMQYVQGTDASALDPRDVGVRRALRIVAETASALDYAHSRAVLHRDVKPANILLSAPDTGRDERAVLTDFGIARLLDATTELTATGMVTATVAFASPEQLGGTPVDHRADQYSLACTLFALLTGRPPFAGRGPGEIVAAHLGQPLPALSRLRNDAPAQLDEVIARATAKRREDRFANCTEFSAAAVAAVDGASMDARRAPTRVAPHEQVTASARSVPRESPGPREQSAAMARPAPPAMRGPRPAHPASFPLPQDRVAPGGRSARQPSAPRTPPRVRPDERVRSDQQTRSDERVRSDERERPDRSVARSASVSRDSRAPRQAGSELAQRNPVRRSTRSSRVVIALSCVALAGGLYAAFGAYRLWAQIRARDEGGPSYQMTGGYGPLPVEYLAVLTVGVAAVAVLLSIGAAGLLARKGFGRWAVALGSAGLVGITILQSLQLYSWDLKFKILRDTTIDPYVPDVPGAVVYSIVAITAVTTGLMALWRHPGR